MQMRGGPSGGRKFLNKLNRPSGIILYVSASVSNGPGISSSASILHEFNSRAVRSSIWIVRLLAASRQPLPPPPARQPQIKSPETKPRRHLVMLDLWPFEEHGPSQARRLGSTDAARRISSHQWPFFIERQPNFKRHTSALTPSVSVCMAREAPCLSGWQAHRVFS